MKYRLVSDGTPAGTKLLNPHGEVVPHVHSVWWGIDKKSNEVRVHLEIGNVELETAITKNVSLLQRARDYFCALRVIATGRKATRFEMVNDGFTDEELTLLARVGFMKIEADEVTWLGCIEGLEGTR